jgi:outer membrane protein OmpA-like peptidoglycan-associated protein
MAELNVEPKQNKPWWLWLLLGLIAVLALIFLLRGCDDDDRDMDRDATTTATTAGATTDRRTTGDNDWNNINRNAPVATYQEITDRDVTVRGDENYAIYSMDEAILFDTDSDQLRPGAEQKLQQVAQSLNQRYANGQVRIYGYTDTRGSADYNEQLAQERAESVRNWLTQNGNIDNDRVSLHPIGEADPVATNETAQGRQQNRRVEIVARRAN